MVYDCVFFCTGNDSEQIGIEPMMYVTLIEGNLSPTMVFNPMYWNQKLLGWILVCGSITGSITFCTVLFIIIGIEEKNLNSLFDLKLITFRSSFCRFIEVLTRHDKDLNF